MVPAFVPDSTPRPRPSGKPVRRKQISCPRCAGRFVAEMSDGNRVHCPRCQARISIRKSSASRHQSAAPLDQTPAPVARLKTKLALGQKPKTTRLVAAAFKDPVPPTPPVRMDMFGQKPLRPRSAAPSKRKALAISGLLLIALLGGYCSWPSFVSASPRDTLTGTVSFEGTPLVSGVVMIQSEDGATTVSGSISPDGTYIVAKVPRGKVRIAVLAMAPADGTNQAWQPLPEAYGELGRSGLSVHVSGATTFNIELTKDVPSTEPVP